MTQPDLVDVLVESCQQIPDTRAGICVDLRSGDVLASQIGEDGAIDPSALADFAARLFAGGQTAALNRLWSGGGDGAEGGDEVVLLERDGCLVLLRSPTRPAYGLILATSGAVDVGLVIARARAVKARFEEALLTL